MEEELLELRDKVDLLTEKVELLERKDNKRKALVYTKVLIKILVLLAMIYGIWRGYEYIVNEVPKILDEKIQEINPIRKNT